MSFEGLNIHTEAHNSGQIVIVCAEHFYKPKYGMNIGKYEIETFIVHAEVTNVEKLGF